MNTPHEALSASARKAIMGQVTAALGGTWHVPGREFFLQDAATVAQGLLGSLLLRAEPTGRGYTLCGGRIVETEAYLGLEDAASHAARGMTPVTEIFYRPGGIAYVYKIYGMYHCLNVIAQPAGQAGCVLLRALEPLMGREAMAARRGLPPERLRELCSGPGRLCQALGIDRAFNGTDLSTGPLFIFKQTDQVNERPEMAHGPRIGIRKAVDLPLRFWLAGSPWVSKAKLG